MSRVPSLEVANCKRPCKRQKIFTPRAQHTAPCSSFMAGTALGASERSGMGVMWKYQPDGLQVCAIWGLRHHVPVNLLHAVFGVCLARGHIMCGLCRLLHRTLAASVDHSLELGSVLLAP